MNEKLHSGALYLPDDGEIMQLQEQCLEKLYDFNQTRPSEGEKRQKMLKDMFAEIGEACYIEPPFHANWGGHHVHFGNRVYANFNLTLVDDTHIYVGDCTMIGRMLRLPRQAIRLHHACVNTAFSSMRRFISAKNCWIGAGALIMPGITIGDNSVIGAGSVVTKDVPANVVAVGNPCRILRCDQ